MSESSFTFRIELGLLRRTSTMYEIKAACMKCGLHCEVLENRGIFESEFQVKVSGPTAVIGPFRERLMQWLAQQQTE